MYYILAAVLFVIVYFALAKILSSILKGCLVTVGAFLLAGTVYYFLISTKQPVTIFDFIMIDNFQVSLIEKT